MDYDINFWLYFSFNNKFILIGEGYIWRITVKSAAVLPRVHRNRPRIWDRAGWFPSPEFLVQQVWEWGLRICISSKFPGNAAADGTRTLLWEPLVQLAHGRMRDASRELKGGSPLRAEAWDTPAAGISAPPPPLITNTSNKCWGGRALRKGNEVAPWTKWHDKAQTVPFLSWRKRECSRLSAWYVSTESECVRNFPLVVYFSPLMAMSFKEGSPDLTSTGPEATRG